MPRARRVIALATAQALILVSGIMAAAGEAPDRPTQAVAAAAVADADGADPTTAVPSTTTSSGGGARAAASGAPASSSVATTTTRPQDVDWTSRPVEVEAVDRGGRRVSDDGATGGTAHGFDGSFEVLPSVPAGSYEFATRVRSDGGRIRLTVDDALVGEFAASGTWQELRVPVFLNGSQPVGLKKIGGSASLVVDWLGLTPSAKGYTAQGTRILGPDGAPFVPRGVNRNSLESSVDGWYWDWGDALAIADWGANIVRVPLSQQFWLAESCDYSPRYRDNVDKAVRLITNAGMVALLDLHHSSRGATCGVNARQKMADELSVEFWREVAARYGGRADVAFDLYNEPRYIPAQVWRDGGVIDGWTAVGMQDLYDAVRSTGARNLVFVEGTGWSIDLRPAAALPLDGYGIVFAPHAYNDGEETLSPYVDPLISPVASDHPVVIGEFGSNVQSGSHNQQVIDYAEARGFGWIAWAWLGGDGTRWELFKEWRSYEPTPAGLPVREALRSHRG